MAEMKLSEAIRLGALLGPQCQGAYSRTTEEFVTVMGQQVPTPGQMSACAISAGLLAVGREDLIGDGDVCADLLFAEFDKVFPILGTHAIGPVEPFTEETVRDIIVGLNDDSGWSRERIADWVATAEVARWPEDEDEVPEAEMQREFALV